MSPEPTEWKKSESRSLDENLLPPEILERMSERSSAIDLVHDALRPALELEDLSRIIVALLVSRKSMGFSRAIAFRWDEDAGCFKGSVAFGVQDRATHDRIQEEMDKAVCDLQFRASPAPGSTDSGDVADLHRQDDTEDRGDQTFWDAILHQFEEENRLQPKIEGLEIAWDPAQAEETADDFIGKLFQTVSCVNVAPGELDDEALPDELKAVLNWECLWVGIRTRTGPSLILIVDKSYEDTPINAFDELRLKWFCGQAGLAMENVELLSHLKSRNLMLKELDTLKSNFLSIISHELRTPLTAISGFTHLLIENKVGPISSGQREILERVVSHAQRLGSVVNDLIEIVEIDSGSAISVNLAPIDPLDVLMETLPDLEPRKATKNITIEPVVSGPIPKIFADPKGLGRIFYHLIDNGIKFSPEGAKVRIEFVPADDTLSISIIDAGIGIAPDRLQLIFDAFYQVDNQLARVYEGMGVGLTLTKKLVNGTGGRMTVESELGRGSTFTLIYPRA